jgi:thioredoxin reductase (NADPH)
MLNTTHLFIFQRLYKNQTVLTDYVNVPTTVFTPLEYGFVGVSEEDAVASYGKDDIEVYHSFYQPLEYALTDRDNNKCYGKLVCVKSKGVRTHYEFHTFFMCFGQPY